MTEMEIDPSAAPGLRGPVVAEHSAIPRAVIVHNPVPLGAFDDLLSVEREQTQRRYLFRARPSSISAQRR